MPGAGTTARHSNCAKRAGARHRPGPCTGLAARAAPAAPPVRRSRRAAKRRSPRRPAAGSRHSQSSLRPAGWPPVLCWRSRHFGWRGWRCGRPGCPPPRLRSASAPGPRQEGGHGGAAAARRGFAPWRAGLVPPPVVGQRRVHAAVVLRARVLRAAPGPARRQKSSF